MKKPISLDLKERIVAAYETEEGTREEVAKRFKVSLGMVKKLLAQKGRTGDLQVRYRYCGRKAKLEPAYGEALLVRREEPDLTLVEIKERLALDCTIGPTHWILSRQGLTYKDASCGRTEPPRHCQSAAAVAAQPRWARPRPVRLPRRVRGQDEPDPPAWPRTPR